MKGVYEDCQSPHLEWAGPPLVWAGPPLVCRGATLAHLHPLRGQAGHSEQGREEGEAGRHRHSPSQGPTCVTLSVRPPLKLVLSMLHPGLRPASDSDPETPSTSETRTEGDVLLTVGQSALQRRWDDPSVSCGPAS